jgi:uncharacterized protein YgbK (DUF1537 family)
MTDANLVRWLGRQTQRVVSLAPLAVVRRGPAALHAFLAERTRAGTAYFIVDALDAGDLAVAAEATADAPFLSGASGITAALASLLFPGRPPLSFAARLARVPKATLVISGSLSDATRAQNAWAAANGFHEIGIPARRILLGEVTPEGVAGSARASLERGRHVLVSSLSTAPGEIEETQRLGAERGLAAVQTGGVIARFLGDVARHLVALPTLGRLIVAGGETSTAVCEAAGLLALEVGLPLAPGVPYSFPLEAGRDMLVVLKSGNFGQVDLYGRVAAL